MKPKVGGGSGGSDAPAAPSAASRFSAAFRGESHSPVPSVVYDGDNVGENKLITCLQQLEVPYKFTLTQRMEEVRIELASIDKFGAYCARFLLGDMSYYLTVFYCVQIIFHSETGVGQNPQHASE